MIDLNSDHIDIADYQTFLEDRLLEIGSITPHALVINQEHCYVVNLAEPFENDVPKHMIMDVIANVAQEQNAHKVIFITEVIFCESKNQYTKEEADKMIHDAEYRESLEQHEAFQMIQITKHEVSIRIREFIRNDTSVTLGRCECTDNLVYHAYQTIQGSLVAVM
jgi:hypothetical protein